MSIVIQNRFMEAASSYLVAGNLCNAFAVGEAGTQDDFFLLGCEPEQESNYPLLTGNIFDSKGKLLCRLVRNALVVNPGQCTRHFSDHVGYEVRDGAGKAVFRVRTRVERLPGMKDDTWVTVLAGRFYNKRGELVLFADGGQKGETLLPGTKCCFGFNGEFGQVSGYGEMELNVVRAVIGSRARINQPITGRHEEEEILLDGKALVDAELHRCKVHVYTGEFARFGQCQLANCEIIFHDAAANVHNMTVGLMQQAKQERADI
jgi:hypothetical protein